MAQPIPLLNPNAQPSVINPPAQLKPIAVPASSAPPVLKQIVPPPPDTGDAQFASQMPSMPAPQLQKINVQPQPLSPLQQNMAYAQGKLAKLRYQDDNPYGTAENHPGVAGKILHGLSVAGNIAGDIFAPVTMANIPGTQLNREIQEHGYTDQLNQEEEQNADEQEKNAQTQNLNLQPELNSEKLLLAQEKQDDVEDKNASQRALQLAKQGQMEVTGPDGKTHIQDDPSSQVYQGRQVLSQYHGAQTELDQARTQLALAGNDPRSPVYQLALRRLQVAQENASAAAERAQAYMGNYLEGAYNKAINGQTLPGAPQIDDGTGNTTVVGTRNAGQAVKAQSNVAQFNDVSGAMDNLERSATDLVRSGGALNSPGVVYALQNARGTPSQIMQSIVKANLSPQEQAYVQSVLAAHENIQALRKSAGGTATDSAVEKLDNLIPNGSTPNLGYLTGQLGQIRQTVGRLGKGVTTVHGGEHLDNQTPTAHGLQVGTVESGFRYKGGDPSSQASWEKVK